MQNRWTLRKGDKGKEIIHIHNNTIYKNFGSSTWNLNDSRNFVLEGVKLWTCLECHKKVPDHMILQWKLLNG